MSNSAVADFRVYPSDSRRGLYVRVLVFRTLTAMRAHVGTRRTCFGVCREWVGRKGKRRDPMFAEVALAVPYLTPYVVPHELLHATFAWQRRLKGRPDEEALCYAHGHMMQQAIAQLAELAAREQGESQHGE